MIFMFITNFAIFGLASSFEEKAFHAENGMTNLAFDDYEDSELLNININPINFHIEKSRHRDLIEDHESFYVKSLFISPKHFINYRDDQKDNELNNLAVLNPGHVKNPGKTKNPSSSAKSTIQELTSLDDDDDDEGNELSIFQDNEAYYHTLGSVLNPGHFSKKPKDKTEKIKISDEHKDHELVAKYPTVSIHAKPILNFPIPTLQQSNSVWADENDEFYTFTHAKPILTFEDTENELLMDLRELIKEGLNTYKNSIKTHGMRSSNERNFLGN